MSKRSGCKPGDYGSQIRLSQHSVVADRKNRLENARHVIHDRILDRQQLRSRFLIDKEQRYVINTFRTMKSSSGNSTLAQAPNGPNDRSYLTSHILQGAGYMTEKRLLQWRSEEQDLQQQLHGSTNKYANKNLNSETEDDKIKKQIMGLMVSIGYTYADVEKIVNALNNKKRNTSEDKVIHNEEDDLLARQVDVFQCLRSQLRPDSKIEFRLPVDLKTNAPFDIHQWQRVVAKSYAKHALDDHRDRPQKTSRSASPMMMKKNVNFHPVITEKHISEGIKTAGISEIEKFNLYTPRSSMYIVERYGGKKLRPQTAGLDRHQLAERKVRSQSVTELNIDIPKTRIEHDKCAPGIESYTSREELDIELDESPYLFPLKQDDGQSVEVTPRIENCKTTIKDYLCKNNYELESDSYKKLKQQQEEHIPQWFKRCGPLTQASDQGANSKPVESPRRLTRWQKDLMTEAPPGIHSHSQPVKVVLGRSKSQRDNELKDLVQKNLLREQMEGILSGQHNRDVQARVKLVKSVMKIENKLS